MDKNKPAQSKKPIIIVIILVLIAAAAFFYFSGEPTDESTSSLTQEGDPMSAQSAADSARIISLLNEIRAIKLEPAFFESTVFKSLIDNEVDVPEQNVGRPNPFIPVPGAFANPTPVTPKR